MLIWRSLALLGAALRAVHAADGPIDWTKAPGGGPSTLRACAQYAYNDNARGGSVNVFLGCSTIACVCRPDLINKAHDHAKDIVEANCGTDAGVDVAAAIKIYDDYCSSNGFSIPGYTYISTFTLRVSSTSSSSTDAATITSPSRPTVTVTAASSPNTTPAVAGSPNQTPLATATVTVFRSFASSGPKPGGWASFIYLAAMMPQKLIFALPDSAVVTYTAPGDAPGGSMVVTATVEAPGPPGVIVQTVIDNGPTTLRTSSTSQTTKATTQNVDSKTNDVTSSSNSGSGSGSGGGGGGPSMLEKIGIIIGILTGLITATVAIWTCQRRRRREDED